MLLTRETFKEADTPRGTGLEYKVTQMFLKAETKLYPTKRVCEVVAASGEKLVIKARHSGVVKSLLVKPGDLIKDGSDLVELEACTHPTMMGNICCDCGVVLEESEVVKTDVVSMLHTVPDLKIKKNVAEKLGKEDMTNLLAQRKLVLLVDLDQTLIHTTNDNIPPNLKDVYHFQINPGGPWYHTRVRPHTKQFLEKISRYYELHICTFGVREYAHYIAHFLDPDHKLFGQRILSRNECLDQMSKKANLSSLFPCGDNLVCIIDDRTDVWNFSPNVVQVLPYHFFRHTGDINAPQGLQKKEDDDQKGFDFENMKTCNYDDNEETDKKNYSSDSDSDKDTKEVSSECGDVSASEENADDKANVDRTEDKVENKSTVKEEDGTNPTENKSTEEKTEISKDEKKNEENGDDVESMEVDDEKSKESSEHTDKSGDKTSEETDKSDDKDKNDDSEKEDIKVKSSKSSKDTESIKHKDFIDVRDDDDYLLYLEDILKKTHKAFFKEYDKCKEQKILPDLKRIIPAIRQDVLKGVNIVFSGVVPQQIKLKESKAYYIATCFGAKVSERLVVRARGDSSKDDTKNLTYTTHMVAANIHTEKVHRARKHKSIKIVSPNWLWSCVERWEHVEEQLFPLTLDTEKTTQRLPPHHCYCPDPAWLKEHMAQEEAVAGPSGGRTRTPSGSMLDDVNPLMFFSPDERNNMANEVDEMLSEENSDDDDDDGPGGDDGDTDEEDEDDSDDDLGMKKKRYKRQEDPYLTNEDSILSKDDEDSLLPSEVFRRGGGLPSDDSDEGVMDDEGDLSRMGADLESLLD